MCGRFTQQLPSSELARIYDAEDLAGDAGAHFNVAPTDAANVVVERARDGEIRRAVVRWRWGFVPHWAAGARVATRAFNARAEGLTRSPLFRDAFARRRCIVPVDSFYEWRRDGRVRQPFRVHAIDGLPLALAGLWAGRRERETGEVIRSCTIVTTAPNAFMASLHDRMPAVLPRAAWATWLAPSGADPGELRVLLEPRDDLPLAMHPVAPLVNSVRNDGPELILPLTLEEPATRTLFERPWLLDEADG